MKSPQERVGLFLQECSETGFDIAKVFSTGSWNAEAGESERLPSFDREDSLAVIIGNSRALWKPLTDTYRANPEALGDNPVETYAARVLGRAAQRFGGAHWILWAHVLEPAAIPIQRIADAIGLAALSPAHLSIHPRFGPWIALRAVVVFDVPWTAEDTHPIENPCGGCETACRPAFDRALREDPRGEHWPTWAAIRDNCPHGQAYRYSDAQVRYHYTKDVAYLRT